MLKRSVQPAARGATYQFAYGLLVACVLTGMLACFPIAILALAKHVAGDACTVTTQPYRHLTISDGTGDNTTLVAPTPTRALHELSIHGPGQGERFQIRVDEVCIRKTYFYPCFTRFK
jgi:hypothetical protein